MRELDPDYWPAPLAHLTAPYLREVDEAVIVAEISDEPANGCMGMRQLYTALIPLPELKEVLATPGGIGSRVESWGPHPCVGPEGGYDSSFWIRGVTGSDQYETLVNAWEIHNQIVMVPDNGLLMCYGLVPRLVDGDTICWDDPTKPVFDVVRAKPLSIYRVPNHYSNAFIRIRREYLEDYLSLKGCAAVGVYYEERYTSDDPTIQAALGTEEAIELKLPGRKLIIRRLEAPSFGEGDQFVRAWGCRLILEPEGRPISEEPALILKWPDHERAISTEQAWHTLGPTEHAYVHDEALVEWQDRSEFDISPDTGNVGYGSWWGTSRSFRYGRHHLALDIRKLYEGTPANVIRHFHRFAVSKAQADRDREVYGDRHIGERAQDVVHGFLQLTGSLSSLASCLDLFIEQDGFGGPTTEKAHYYGWWTLDVYKKLAHVVPVGLPQSTFLSRCAELYKVVEPLKPGPIKSVLGRLGFSKEDFRELKSLRLLAMLCQVATIAKQQGLDLVDDFEHLKTAWEKQVIVPAMETLFALKKLRDLNSHIDRGQFHEQLTKALKSFGIESAQMNQGWGLGLDTVYDRLADSLIELANLIATSYANSK